LQYKRLIFSNKHKPLPLQTAQTTQPICVTKEKDS